MADPLLTADEMRQIVAHAETAYPEECVGVIFFDQGGSTHFRLPNISDHPRESFRVNAAAQWAIRMYRDAEARFLLYHSHPDGTANLSSVDRKALLLPDGTPLFPEAVHLVVAVTQGKVSESRAFTWDASEQDFIYDAAHLPQA